MAVGLHGRAICGAGGKYGEAVALDLGTVAGRVDGAAGGGPADPENDQGPVEFGGKGKRKRAQIAAPAFRGSTRSSEGDLQTEFDLAAADVS